MRFDLCHLKHTMAEEQIYLAQLNQSRRQAQESIGENVESDEQSTDKQLSISITSEPAYFPWGIFFVALIFDIIGIVPIINLFTELLASLIIWFWQKMYVPQVDPLLSLFVNKIIDFFSLGLFPSNIGMVLVAYIKKKTHSLAQTPIVKKAVGV